MKVNVNLGVATAKELKKPHDCYLLGEEATRLSDGLLFAEYFFRGSFTNPTPKIFSETELEIIRAGVMSTGGIAHRLSYKDLPEGMKSDLLAYNTKADALRNRLRPFVGPKKDGTPPQKFTEKDQKNLKASIEKLRTKANEMIYEVERLCLVEKKEKATKPAVSGNVIRTGMSGRSAPTVSPAPVTEEKRRFIYPSFSRPAFHKNRRRT